MTTFIKSTLGIFLSILAVGLLLVLYYSKTVQAEATSGLPAVQMTATTTVVGPQQTKTLFNANPVCTSRVVRTQGQEIYLLFADPTNGDLASTTLAINAGFLQGASTTVAYDSGIYGCGKMTAEATASTTITTAEFN